MEAMMVSYGIIRKTGHKKPTELMQFRHCKAAMLGQALYDRWMPKEHCWQAHQILMTSERTLLVLRIAPLFKQVV